MALQLPTTSDAVMAAVPCDSYHDMERMSLSDQFQIARTAVTKCMFWHIIAARTGDLHIQVNPLPDWRI